MNDADSGGEHAVLTIGVCQDDGVLIGDGGSANPGLARVATAVAVAIVVDHAVRFDGRDHAVRFHGRDRAGPFGGRDRSRRTDEERGKDAEEVRR